MGFTLAQLVRHRELVAIMAGGISLRRVARPVLIVALGMMVLQAANQEFIVPRIAPLLTRDHGDAGRRDLREFEVSLTSDNFGRLFYARRFDPEAGALEDVRIWERDPQGRAVQRIDSPRATWTGSAWRLESPEVFALKMADPAAGRESGLVRTKAAETLLVPTGLDPAALMLRHYENFSQSLSHAQITRLLRSPNLEPRLRDKLERVRFGRISSMLTSLLSLIISLPFFLTREPRNMVVQSLKCAPIGLGSLLGGVLCASAPIPGMPAALVAMLPVLVLVCVAVAATGMLKT
jgi:lipopolysaccharide export system permease protein